jgi:predicted small metal-binding protein
MRSTVHQPFANVPATDRQPGHCIMCHEADLNPSSQEPEMAQKQVSCDCGKVIREGNDDQLVAAVQKHAREVHNMELSREQVLSMSEPV